MKRLNNSGSGMSTPDEAGPGGTASIRRREWLWMALTIGGLLLVVCASPLSGRLEHVENLRPWLAGMGLWAPAVFMLAMSGLTAMGVPRILLYPVAGVTFGFGWGLAWSMIATLAGGYATFAYARWAGRGLILTKWPRVGALSEALRGRGFLSVALIRQLPGPGFLFNLVFGISGLRHRSFLLGTAIGALPTAVPAVMIGAGLADASAEARAGMLTAGLLGLAAVWLTSSLVFRRKCLSNPIYARCGASVLPSTSSRR